MQPDLTLTPTTFKEAASSSDKQKWKNAMDAEMKSLEGNEVWDLVLEQKWLAV